MKKIIKYVLLTILSITIGWLSYKSDVDYVASLEPSFVQLLIALLMLYSTISSLVITRVLLFKESISKKADISPIVCAMKRNVVIETIIIIVSVSFVVSTHYFINDNQCDLGAIIRNSLIVFSIFYFVWVVYDTAMGLYDLLKFEADYKE